MGGELNAATSREHTVVYARVADHHLDEAIDVMSDMVYALFAEVDSEREVVLEEIAMYEDQPQELVHDLIAEAVFGHHPLGRPVIGTAEVISSVSRRATTAYHRSMYVPGNIVVAAAGYLDHNELLGLLEQAESKVGESPGTGACPLAAREAAAARPALHAQGHRAVPPVPRGARHCAVRPPPFRRVAAGRDPRRIGVVAALPGDPQKRGWPMPSTRSRRSTPTPARSGCTSARGRESRPLPRDRGGADRGNRFRQPAAERARAGEGEPEGPILLSMEATSTA